jgi:outer membrane protein assembly factor BamE (lipoprotein component of BamABCDE complex)
MRTTLIGGRTALLALASGLALGACTPTVDVRGYVPTQASLDQIRPGVDNRESVKRMLGTPTSTDPFRDNTWFYISRKTETVAFYEPELIEQTVVAVDFDQKGIVQKVDHYSEKDGKRIDFVTRETPTRGRELTFLGQMFSNLGRFNNKGNELPTNNNRSGGSGRP